MLSAAFVEAEGEAVVMGVLGAVSVCSRKEGAVEAEGEGVQIGVLVQLVLRVKALNKVCFVQ